MKNAFRIIITLLAFIASFFFIYWISFLLPFAHNLAFIPEIISLLIALVIGFFIYKKLANISNNLVVTMFLGGIILGTLGFIA